MARSIWSGVISFGLVSVPVRMYSATHEHEVSFHQFQKGTSDRIRYQRVNERTGKEVDYDDIVKGADVGDDEYVMLDPDELDSVAPGRSKSMEIHRFVDIDTIDPIYYQKTYYLGPGSDETAKTYALLRDAMAEANRAAIGTLVMRGKEYLTAVRPHDKLLMLQTMFFSDEVRDPGETLETAPGRSKASPQEMKMANQLIDSMSEEWDPADFRDTYTDRVKELIAAKKAGGEVSVAEEAPEATNAKDLMQVLRQSVEAARQRSGTGGTGGTAKKATSRKAADRPATKATAATADKSKTKPAGRATQKSSGANLTSLTKAQLSAMARDLDIPGRSAMDRRQLEAAVKKASSGRKTR
jgi:DNA end-binding protein Ku